MSRSWSRIAGQSMSCKASPRCSLLPASQTPTPRHRFHTRAFSGESGKPLCRQWGLEAPLSSPGAMHYKQFQLAVPSTAALRPGSRRRRLVLNRASSLPSLMGSEQRVYRLQALGEVSTSERLKQGAGLEPRIPHAPGFTSLPGPTL